jgi:integrase/recombinase XerC
VLQEWGERRIDEPKPSEIELLACPGTDQRRRDATPEAARSAAGHLVAAVRWLYRWAVAHGYPEPGDNPALTVSKPRQVHAASLTSKLLAGSIRQTVFLSDGTPEADQ